MNFAGILASGMGKRMKMAKVPKQFLTLGDKPLIIHTIEKFLIISEIDVIIVAVAKDWMNHMEKLINKYCNHHKIHIIEGGKTRNETIINICNYIRENYKKEKNILVTHDAVRPFLTQRIIQESIEVCKKYGVADTIIPATDTIVESKDGNVISNIPIRNEMYQGQTPQSFYVNEFIETYESLTEEQKNILTDACKVYVMKGKKVGLVLGEPYNIKITTEYDFLLAKLILNNIWRE